MERHLFVPGLLGSVADDVPDDGVPLAYLKTLLARSDRQGEPIGYAAALCELFGIRPPLDGDLPTAAINLFGETGNAPGGFVMHADPLQLVPDRDSVLAFGLADDGLAGDELSELVGAFNRHFGDAGLRLFASPDGRLYLGCERPPSIRTQPLDSVIGRNLDHHLPEGPQQRRWRGLLNETQMLCHGLAFNQAREAQGRPIVSGLWFSGGGTLPRGIDSTVARLVGDCPLAKGLVALGQRDGDTELVVEWAAWRALMRADSAGWTRSLAELDRRLPEWRHGCTLLHLHPCDGTVFRWHKGADRRFWRRPKPLRGYRNRATGSNRAGSGPGV